MAFGVISEIGYICIHSSNIEQSLGHARDILGLVETDRTGNAVFLSSRAKRHHELVYIDAQRDAVGQVGLIAAGPTGLREARRRVQDAGYPILTDLPLHPGVEDGFSFAGPEGFIFEIYIGPQKSDVVPAGHAPDRFGHVNLHPKNVEAMRHFFVDVLDFRVSDIIGDDFAYFLRCNTEHHGIALIRGAGWLHHHAWQVQSIAELGKVADRLCDHGMRLLMGPVRHGAGHNMAAYYVEPSGAVVELYTDLEHIYDDERPPVIWPAEDQKWATRWALYDFTEFRSHGLFPAGEAVSAE
ncbi:VOC family protein [Nesterenkonia muleiensis]|uniref:VOC family protein n=1 Tax=Nesterenkonia muleiensis TaxID=2282648 RepID=UPI000E70F11F|nr:VOC family protein [Nesterenkonia muleiensis]